jgi:AcrR family transcriptional regulator
MNSHSSDSAHDTRRRLLEAALLLFAEKGIDGTGIREIASLAKANSAMVQYHFGGKEGLYLEVLRHTFEQGPTWIHTLAPPPAPGTPGAREAALACLKDYVSAFLRDLLHCQEPNRDISGELDRAANLLWNREMQYPRPSTEQFIREAIRPFRDHLHGILAALRPDLEGEAGMLMEMSIQAQLMWIHNHMGLTRIMRGAAYSEADLDYLTEHFYEFCLGGLGLPEARSKQGDAPCR